MIGIPGFYPLCLGGQRLLSEEARCFALLI